MLSKNDATKVDMKSIQSSKIEQRIMLIEKQNLKEDNQFKDI